MSVRRSLRWVDYTLIWIACRGVSRAYIAGKSADCALAKKDLPRTPSLHFFLGPRTGAILVFVVSRNQWQHYLPQVYLKGFATPTGEVWRYDRDNGALKPLGTPIIGAEKDL